MNLKLFEIIQSDPTLFDIFISKEEYYGKKDEHSRFKYAFSSNKDVFNPVVSNYLVNEELLDISWPENHNFAACLTHDVDSIYPSWKYVLFTATKYALKLKPAKSVQRLFGKIQKDRSSNPYRNFRKILQIEERYGGKSSFYFKTALRDPIGWIYDIDNFKDELGAITDVGGEVGLHGGYYSYNDPNELKKEKDKLEKALGKNVVGIRMHYLRFNVPDTWRLLADLGFEYDTTFGYDDMPGFRNGMAHPFRPYDMNLEKEINILELPLVIMDGSLFKMSLEEAWEIINKLVEVTEKNKGVITILWHNTTFDKIFWNGWTKLYEKIMQLLKERNAWMTTGKEIYTHWIKNVTLKKL